MTTPYTPAQVMPPAIAAAVKQIDPTLVQR